MRTKTVSDSIAELLEPKPDVSAIVDVLRELPADLPAPTASNFRTSDGCDGWLSWHGPSYDPENTYNPQAIAAALFAAGWQPVPATLVKWDNYRRSVYPAAVEDVPETSNNRYKLTDTEPIAPMWVDDINAHTSSEFRFFVRTVAGRVLKIALDIPAGLVGVNARRIDFRGGWRYEPSSAKLRYPQAWYTILDAQISARSYAYADTYTGLSGAIYWTPSDHDQTDYPHRPDAMIAELLAASRATVTA